MTARASTLEHTCSSCKSLVLRGDAAAAPTCSSCRRVVCDACELGGLCGRCVNALWTQPLDARDDERVPVVVGGCSLPGTRPEVSALWVNRTRAATCGADSADGNADDIPA